MAKENRHKPWGDGNCDRRLNKDRQSRMRIDSPNHICESQIGETKGQGLYIQRYAITIRSHHNITSVVTQGVGFYGWFGFAVRAGAKRDFVRFQKVYLGNGKGLQVSGVEQREGKSDQCKPPLDTTKQSMLLSNLGMLALHSRANRASFSLHR